MRFLQSNQLYVKGGCRNSKNAAAPFSEIIEKRKGRKAYRKHNERGKLQSRPKLKIRFAADYLHDYLQNQLVYYMVAVLDVS